MKKLFSKANPKYAALFVAFFAFVGVYFLMISRADNIATLSLSSPNGYINLGAIVDITVTENSGSNINAVEADITYDQTKFQFVKIDDSNSAFPVGALTPTVANASGGLIKIAKGSTTPLIGQHVVTTLVFTAIGAGTTGMNFASTSALVSSVDNKNVLSSTMPGNYLLADTTPPTSPTGLTATPGATSVSISWLPSTDNVGVVGYKVYRNSILIGSTAQLQFIDNGLIPSNSYSYTVAAYDAANNISQPSLAVGIQTLPGPIPPPVITHPKKPIVLGDLNDDGHVDILDLSILLHNWGLSGSGAAGADLSGDGMVNIYDLSILLHHWTN